MGLLDLLQQVVAGNPEAGFEQVVQHASTSQIGAGLAAAMRSDATPPFSETVGKLFNAATSTQQVGMLNQILAALGPAAVSALAGGALGRLLAPGQTQLTPDQTLDLTPAQVTEIAAHAEQAHPGIVDQLSQFYAQHAGLVKMVGGVALTIALAKMKEHAAER